MKKFVEVFNRDLKRVAILENAFDIGYMLEKNKLSTAEFSLKIDDDKNKYCRPFNYVKIYDNGELVGLFRILPLKLEKSENTSRISYECEHVLGMLIDTIIFKTQRMGGDNEKTQAVLKKLLDKQRNWILNKCEFDRKFEYEWTNDNLLSAILDVPKRFKEDYIFTYDTSVYPWKLSLIKPDESIRAYIRYDKNMKGIVKKEDGSSVVTRLYPLGDDIDISSVNPTGKVYIESDTVNKYGIIERIWSDERYKVVEALYADAVAKLEILKEPNISYTIDAAELYGLTKLDIDKFNIGDYVRVIDSELGINIKTQVIRKSKSKIEDDFVSASVQLTSEESGFIDTLSDMYEKVYKGG